VDKDCKRHGQTDPEGTHEQGLFERNDAVLAAYDCEIENKQEKNYRIKDNPEPNVHGRLAADREQDEISHAGIISVQSGVLEKLPWQGHGHLGMGPEYPL
jgi:hypothetical protein